MVKRETKPVKSSAKWITCPEWKGTGIREDTSFEPPREFGCPDCHGSGAVQEKEEA